MSNQLATTGNAVANKKIEVAREIVPMDKLMEMADMMAKSTIVPQSYQHRPENCFIALDLASRMGLSALVVMQNLFVIQGKPSWSGQAIASMLRASGQFKEIDLVYVGTVGKDDWGAYITAKKSRNGAVVKGGTVTIGVAKAEGWFQKNGSKWKTMPELMLAYRAYAWFTRVHAPELLMGLQSVEEVEDVNQPVEVVVNPFGDEDIVTID